MKRSVKRLLSLTAAVLWMAACLAGVLAGRSSGPARDLATKLEAAALMERWMGAIREYKAQAGLAFDPEDLHQTGLIGEAYTSITTTNGSAQAKRTTADPDMAALLVELLTQAGIGPGDAVGAGFSGSFPGLNLAVLAACQTMGIRCVYVASVGASTYGANQPELTFPDMAYRLVQDGLLDTPPGLVTPGGSDDCGYDMDPAVLEGILQRLRGYGAQVLVEPDLQRNIEVRDACYQNGGPIRCFIGVGGNVTTTGLGEKDVGWGLIAPYGAGTYGETDGLIQKYSAQGLPTIHLLNVKQLVADYGMAYDPALLPARGESAIYQTVRYPKWLAAVGALGGAAMLLAGFRRPGEEKP